MTTGSDRDRIALNDAPGCKSGRIHAIIGREVGDDTVGSGRSSLLR